MQSGQTGKERDVLVPTMCLPALRVCQVSAGGMHSLALTEDGNLWTWGEPWGSFSMTIDRRPHRVEVEDPEEIVERGGFVAIACGAFHNLALTASGEIYSFGLNDYGQLGLGHTASVTAPQRIVDGLEGVTVADISCGGWHSACISTRGEVFVWGRGEYGRLGLGDKSGSSKLRPAKVWALEGVKMVQVSCGGSHTLGVTADGKAWAWGRGSFGRLGTGEERDAITPVEVKLPGGPERWHVIAVAAGGRHSLCFAVPDNGNLLEEQSSSGWEQQQRRQQRSPMGLSPQSSGIRLNSAAIAAAAAAAAAVPVGGGGAASAGGGGLETDGGADDELSTSPDGDSPLSSGGGGGHGGDHHTNELTPLQTHLQEQDINIPAPSQNHHQVQHRHQVQQQQQHEAEEEGEAPAAAGIDVELNTINDNDDDSLLGEDSLEELIAQAPSVMPNNNSKGGASATPSMAASSVGAHDVVGVGVNTPVESLISQGVASLGLQEQQQIMQRQHNPEGTATATAGATQHQAPYLELSPSKQRTRHYRGRGRRGTAGATSQGGARTGSPKRGEEKAAQENQRWQQQDDDEEEEEDEEYGDVEPSEQGSDSEVGVVREEVRRAVSTAAATMRGLRDDLLGDNS
jgi:Regulator of chromosome condensation (RCC1) repeat